MHCTCVARSNLTRQSSAVEALLCNLLHRVNSLTCVIGRTRVIYLHVKMIMNCFPCSFIPRMKVVTVTTTLEEGVGGERGGASQGVGESELSQSTTQRRG